MGLPPEIRQKIFSIVIQPDEIEEKDIENRWLTEHLGDLVAVHFSDQEPPRLIKAYEGAPGEHLLRVSRTCYQEALSLLYERQGFYLFNDSDWSMWWRLQPFLCPTSFELHHTKHPVPNEFAFIRELAFQPRPEISVDFVRAIERTFPSLKTLRAFRHIYLHEPDGRLTGQLPDVWREFHRFVLLASVVLTTHHSSLKFAKWSDWRFFPHDNADVSIRTMTVKLTPDDVLSSNEVFYMLRIHLNTEHRQEGLLDLERIAKLPLSDADAWREAVHNEKLCIESFFVTNGVHTSRLLPEQSGSRPGRVRSSDSKGA
jgi:hypothetical protein